ncbi:MAG TPA: divalent cation tolerance protein CutA [Polyangiales bacterium]|nr:divalent cation tolerance protein CutA [Polyangiales bacterium]
MPDCAGRSLRYGEPRSRNDSWSCGTPCPRRRSARELARVLIAQRLAACVKVLPYSRTSSRSWTRPSKPRRQHGTDLLLAVDTSKSMLAEDLRPTRLARAKLAIEDWIERVAGERLGLIAFAATPSCRRR